VVAASLKKKYDSPEADAEEVRVVKELAGGLLVAPRGV